MFGKKNKKINSNKFATNKKNKKNYSTKKLIHMKKMKLQLLKI